MAEKQDRTIVFPVANPLVTTDDEGHYVAITFNRFDRTKKEPANERYRFAMSRGDALTLLSSLKLFRDKFEFPGSSATLEVLKRSPDGSSSVMAIPVGNPILTTNEGGHFIVIAVNRVDYVSRQLTDDQCRLLLSRQDGMQLLGGLTNFVERFRYHEPAGKLEVLKRFSREKDYYTRPLPSTGRPGGPRWASTITKDRLPQIRFPPPGKCIYCGSLVDLTDEHIWPRALGGHFVLEKASCRKCADITKQFEQVCMRQIFGPLRFQLRYPSRSKGKEWPKKLPLWLEFEKRCDLCDIPIEDYPPVRIPLPRMEPPGMIMGGLKSSVFHFETTLYSLEYPGDKARLKNLYERTGATNAIVHATLYLGPLAQLLAKIAHGWCTAKYGLGAFAPILPNYIRGLDDTLPYVVGSFAKGDTPDFGLQPLGHDAWDLLARNSSTGEYLLCVGINLFGIPDVPIYSVVVGKPTLELVQKLTLTNAQVLS